MTLTLRSASTSTATTKGSALTHAEMDANWLHLAQSSGVEFLQSGTGAVATTLQARGRLEVWSADFGHSPSASAADNDTALVAAITAVYNAGGGTVRIAAGSFNHITVPYNWLATKTVGLRGEGKKATYLVKSGATSSAVLDFSADTGVLDTQAFIEDLSITGNAKGNVGITCTTLARITTKNLGITACSTGWNSVGCLIAKHDNITLNSNDIGFKSRKSGSIYCNIGIFEGGEVRANSSFGFDIGDMSGFMSIGTDIEANGTTSNTATGQVIIRSTVDDEFGYSQIGFYGAWFEGGLGTNFKVEAATGLLLTLEDVLLLSSEAGLALDVGAINTVTLRNVLAPSSGDTVTLAATTSIIDGGTIYTLTDTSTNRNYRSVGTNSGTTQMQVTSSAGTFRVNNGNARTGGGTVATTSAVAATIIATTAIGAMYLVYAYIAGVGSAYMAYAVIGTDGTNAARITGQDGANMTITVSGANVQVTQTSGAGQTVSYEYLRIA